MLEKFLCLAVGDFLVHNLKLHSSIFKKRIPMSFLIFQPQSNHKMPEQLSLIIDLFWLILRET